MKEARINKLEGTKIEKRLLEQNKKLVLIRKDNDFVQNFTTGFHRVIENESSIDIDLKTLRDILTFYKLDDFSGKSLEMQAARGIFILFNYKNLQGRYTLDQINKILNIIRANTCFKVIEGSNKKVVLDHLCKIKQLAKMTDFTPLFFIDSQVRLFTSNADSKDYIGKVIAITFDKDSCEFKYITTFSQVFSDQYKEICEKDLSDI